MLTSDDITHLYTHGCPACREITDRELVKVTYRGWPGHFVASRHCMFRLNTLVESGACRVVVSTVGNMWTPDKKPARREELMVSSSARAYYETMAFHAYQDQGGYWDADVGRPVSLVYGKRFVKHLGATSDAEAQEMHEAAVQQVARRIRRGELG